MQTDAKLGIATALALATCLLAPGVTARPGAQAPDAQSPGGQPTFRAGTRLATFDAVVTDRKGRHVTDLTPADFEVVERGRRQTVRQVAYVHAVRPDGAPTAAAGADAPAAPAPAMPGASGLPSREQTGRVMAIVVDDLRMSFRSTVDVRTMLNRYVDRQLRPGDLVAIIRTAGGAGALQQFTTDCRLLKAAIERVRGSARVWPSQSVRPLGGRRRGAGRSLRARRHARRLARRPGVRRARHPGAAGTQDRGVRVAGFRPGHGRQPAERRPARSRPRHRHRQPGRGRHVRHRSAGAREPEHGLDSRPSGHGPTRATPAPVWPSWRRPVSWRRGGCSRRRGRSSTSPGRRAASPSSATTTSPAASPASGRTRAAITWSASTPRSHRASGRTRARSRSA